MSLKKIDGYTIFMNQKLGQGSFGTVYRAQSDHFGKPYAVKVIKKKDIDADAYMKEALISQIKIMRSINSQNCVKCIDVMESRNNYYVIQQLCQSDLGKQMKKKPNRIFPQDQAINILTQICNGFLTLVKEGIVHRDLKPQNILLSKGKAKICDFGFSKQCKKAKQDQMLKSVVGTPLYMPKEILQRKTYTSKCDIWGIGFIFYEMLHGHTPWSGHNQQILLYNLCKQPLSTSNKLSTYTVDFLRRSLAVNELHRMSWNELFRHPIFKGNFQAKIKKNQILYNSYKKMMGDIRFYVRSENIDLRRLWESLGYDENKELNENEFYELLGLITPQFETKEEKYFFDEMDENKDGVISLLQIEKEFQHYEIPLVSVQGIPAQNLQRQTEKIIMKCFERLYLILMKKKVTLNKVFDVYDKDKNGVLDFTEFSKIITKLDPSVQQNELKLIFKLIDTDESNSIDFQQFNIFYCKTNGVAPKLYQRNRMNPQ